MQNVKRLMAQKDAIEGEIKELHDVLDSVNYLRYRKYCVCNGWHPNFLFSFSKVVWECMATLWIARVIPEQISMCTLFALHAIG